VAAPAARAARGRRPRGEFDPEIRHRTNDSVTSLALIADGQAVALLPRLVRPEAHLQVAVRAIAEGSLDRTLFAATRAADAKRPSVQALLAAVRAAACLEWPAPGQAAA
jgi:DNA-binding transcriptional LysR family regulator